MKKKLIYLLISFCLFAIFGKTDSVSHAEVSSHTPEFSLINSDYSFSATESAFCAPRPTNIANTQRVQTVSKRTSTIGRENSAVIKKGKFINRNSTLSFHNSFNLFPSGFSEPGNHLLSLRKLLI